MGVPALHISHAFHTRGAAPRAPLTGHPCARPTRGAESEHAPLPALSGSPARGRSALFVHSSADGHLGFFHLLATVNRAAVNMCIHIFV